MENKSKGKAVERIYTLLDEGSFVEIGQAVTARSTDFQLEEIKTPSDGVVTGYDLKPERIVIRAYRDHIPYLKSLPLHHSQRVLEDNGEYADFELFLAPTYDFVMRLLHVGAMIEVISPTSLRKTMKGWISDMYNLYKND